MKRPEADIERDATKRPGALAREAAPALLQRL